MRKEGITIYKELAEYSARHNLLKPYALYLSIKAKFNHSIIYNFSYRKVAKLVGLSDKTAKLYISKLKKHGFVEIRDGHLLFKSQFKIAKELAEEKKELYRLRGKGELGEIEKIRTRFQAFPFTSFDGILNRLKFYLLYQNARQQEFMSIARTGTKVGKIKLTRGELKKAFKRYRNGHENKELDKAIRSGQNIFDNAEESHSSASCRKSGDIIISSVGVGKIFNVSSKTANNWLRRLSRLGYIKTKPVVERLKTKIEPEVAIPFVADLNKSECGYYFYWRGNIYQHHGTSIVFTLNRNTRKERYDKMSPASLSRQKMISRFADPANENYIHEVIRFKSKDYESHSLKSGFSSVVRKTSKDTKSQKEQSAEKLYSPTLARLARYKKFKNSQTTKIVSGFSGFSSSFSSSFNPNTKDSSFSFQKVNDSATVTNVFQAC